MSTQSPKLLDQVRHTCRRRGYSYRTEQAYTSWTRRFVRFHNTTHPRDLDASDVRAFLNHLATERGVAASTQNQALNALVFLYQQVLHLDLDDIGTIERANPHFSRDATAASEAVPSAHFCSSTMRGIACGAQMAS